MGGVSLARKLVGAGQNRILNHFGLDETDAQFAGQMAMFEARPEVERIQDYWRSKQFEIRLQTPLSSEALDEIVTGIFGTPACRSNSTNSSCMYQFVPKEERCYRLDVYQPLQKPQGEA